MKMRIISGEFGGRLIDVPQSKFIRPTTDRVRETLFNILNNMIDFEGIRVLDIYAGSGSLGLECLSRGAGSVDFVEKNFVIYKTLEKNIKSLSAGDACRIFKTDAVSLSSAKRDLKYDLILADPPFFKDDIYVVVNNLFENNFLGENGLMVIERSKQTRAVDEGNFMAEEVRVVGDAWLYFKRLRKR